MSAKDIAAGTRWLETIAKELGIVCVTRENRTSPWLNFEAGAVANGVGGDGVVPLAIDLDIDHLELPLSQFQAHRLSQPGILEVLEALNARRADPLSDARVVEACEVWWPRLEQKLEGLGLDLPLRLMRLRELMERTDSLERMIGRAYGRSAHEKASERLVDWCREVERELQGQDPELCLEFRQTGGPEPRLWDRTSRQDLPDMAWDRNDSKRLRSFLQMKTDALGSALANLE